MIAAVLPFVPATTDAAPVKNSTTSTRSTTATRKGLTLKPKKTTYSAKAARARRATVERARVASQSRLLAEAQQPRFKEDGTPDVRAEAAIIYNPENGQILWEENAQDQRSIASITKVMTAVVFLENSPDLTREVVVDRSDVYQASTTHIRAGYRMSTGDLLHFMLIASDNGAARALARVSPYGSEGFVRRMNEKAKELGLTSTSYADPSGLYAANVSSAYDMARLITYVSGDDRIASIMRTPYYSVTVGRQVIQVHSTNQLVMRGDVDVQAGKTGFIGKAGYCLATLLRLPEGGPQVAVVVLGAKSNPGRFWETRHLFNWLSAKTGDFFGSAPAPDAAAPAAAN